MKQVEIKHRARRTQIEKFKDLTLRFADGNQVKFTMGEDQSWNVVDLSAEMPIADSLKITVNSIYGGPNPGFAEIKLTTQW